MGTDVLMGPHAPGRRGPRAGQTTKKQDGENKVELEELGEVAPQVPVDAFEDAVEL
jgi:hypothetical protein